MTIATKATYLGVALGPGADADDMWQGVLAKWRSRMTVIKQQEGAMVHRHSAFDQRVLSLVPYLAQLLPVHDEIRREEMKSWASVMKWPMGSFCRSSLQWLEEWNGPRCTLVSMIGAASLIRAAMVSFPEWSSLIGDLRKAAEIHLPMGPWHRGELSLLHWKLPPIVLNLEHASKGFASLPGSSPMAKELRQWGTIAFDSNEGAPPADRFSQKSLLAAFRAARPTDPIPGAICARWTKMGDPALSEVLGRIDWNEMRLNLHQQLSTDGMRKQHRQHISGNSSTAATTGS